MKRRWILIMAVVWILGGCSMTATTAPNPASPSDHPRAAVPVATTLPDAASGVHPTLTPDEVSIVGFWYSPLMMMELRPDHTLLANHHANSGHSITWTVADGDLRIDAHIAAATMQTITSLPTPPPNPDNRTIIMQTTESITYHYHVDDQTLVLTETGQMTPVTFRRLVGGEEITDPEQRAHHIRTFLWHPLNTYGTTPSSADFDHPTIAIRDGDLVLNAEQSLNPEFDELRYDTHVYADYLTNSASPWETVVYQRVDR